MKLSLTLEAEDAEIAQHVAASSLHHVGWPQSALAAINVLLTAQAVGVLVLLMGAYLFGVPNVQTAVQLSFYLLCAKIPLDLARSSLEGRTSRLRLANLYPRALDLEISQSGLAITDHISRVDVLWSAVTKIEHDGKYIYVHHMSHGALAIPARCFSTYAEFEQFHTELLKHAPK
jgi:hypothetical protein